MKRPWYFLIVWLMLSLIGSNGSAQDFLRFEKRRNRTADYYVGDKVSFWIKDHPSKITGQIRGFEDSLIIFSHFQIPVGDITHLYVDRKISSWYAVKYKTMLLPMAGAGYLGLDVLNTGELAPRTLAIGGGLIGGGFLLKWIVGKRIKVRGRKRKLIIVSL